MNFPRGVCVAIPIELGITHTRVSVAYNHLPVLLWDIERVQSSCTSRQACMMLGLMESIAMGLELCDVDGIFPGSCRMGVTKTSNTCVIVDIMLISQH